MLVGRTKDQGFYNKPSAAVHPGSLAAGTLPQYNTTGVNIRCGQNIYFLNIETDGVCSKHYLYRSHPVVCITK